LAQPAPLGLVQIDPPEAHAPVAAPDDLGYERLAVVQHHVRQDQGVPLSVPERRALVQADPPQADVSDDRPVAADRYSGRRDASMPAPLGPLILRRRGLLADDLIRPKTLAARHGALFVSARGSPRAA